MTPLTASPPPIGAALGPEVPPEVRRFAEEKGVAAYLPAVLAMTRRVFSQGEPVATVQEDEEDPRYRSIVFDVDVTSWTSEEMLTAMHQWSREIAAHCPSTHAPYFTYRVEERA